MNFILPVIFIVFGGCFIVISLSKKFYLDLVKNNGEEYAKRYIKRFKIGGFFLLIVSGMWLGFNFYTLGY
jgi:hypothetical protein